MMFEMYNLPPITDEYFKNKEKTRHFTETEVWQYINGSRIGGKINTRLDLRVTYHDNGNSPHQYFPFDPFKF